MPLSFLYSLLLIVGCNVDPGHTLQGVDYRNPGQDDLSSGERGNIIISEVMWSGSVQNDGVWDPSDVFLELRNEGMVPINPSLWHIEMEGVINHTWIIPESDRVLDVGEHGFIAAKNSGCFPEPDWIIPSLAFPAESPFLLILTDVDEHLIERVGDREKPPYSGGYDLVESRSMERIELMFGPKGSEPHAWHFYTEDSTSVPNNDRILDSCQGRTLASPGRANSPDYSGAVASGGFE